MPQTKTDGERGIGRLLLTRWTQERCIGRQRHTRQSSLDWSLSCNSKPIVYTIAKTCGAIRPQEAVFCHSNESWRDLSETKRNEWNRSGDYDGDGDDKISKY